ncbi:MAG: tRNA (adenosine(37)-N6)-dimethylallyltransferase MiaA [Nitrospirae bacterium]|nr:tRNA (adenosine(37)-N6)-dimethylallyltransferase MiaA [Nitrospirota bacterium]
MNKVIILLGPTGVGKTEASILLAKALGTEIISADSMQIYRGMDIGTAKPLKQQREEVKHHMIDIIEPSDSYSVGSYIKDVTPIIENLLKQDKIPLVVGGTGLYIKAMTRGIFSGPSADRKLREELLSLEDREEGFLYNYLNELDPIAAGRIMPADTRRIIRAIEVCLKTRQGISELQQEATKPLPYGFIKIGLKRDRKELYRIIEARVDAMIEQGLIEEVKKILNKNPDRTPMQAIGYKEIAMHIRRDISLDETVSLIKKSTRRYAKRQFTWFNREEDIRWIDITGIYDSHKVFRSIQKVLNDILKSP